VQQLYQLQLLDSEVDRLRHQLAEITANLGESVALKQAQTVVESTNITLHKLQATIQDLNLELKSLVEKITHEEKTLYQGKAISAKQASNLQDEIASLKRRRGQREEALLEAMVQAEETETQLTQAQNQLAKLQANWQSEQERLTQTQAELKSKLSLLQEQRPAMITEIDPDDLDEYEDLRRQKGGRAVAAAKNGVCQGCGMTASNNKLQQARAGVELIYCGTCRRILYVA
jgi:hypothetical protein